MWSFTVLVFGFLHQKCGNRNSILWNTPILVSSCIVIKWSVSHFIVFWWITSLNFYRDSSVASWFKYCFKLGLLFEHCSLYHSWASVNLDSNQFLHNFILNFLFLFLAQLVQKKRGNFKIELLRNWFESGFYRASIFNKAGDIRFSYVSEYIFSSFILAYFVNVREILIPFNLHQHIK